MVGRKDEKIWGTGEKNEIEKTEAVADKGC